MPFLSKTKSELKSHLVHLLCEGFVLLCCRWVDFRDSEMFINKFWFIVFFLVKAA